MCLITVKYDDNGKFGVEDFRNSHNRNSDGTGIMYVEDGRIKVEKTMGNLKEHLALFYKHMNRDHFILHQRLATHGTKDLTNVHPFKVLDIDEGDPFDLYFCHNGVISASKFSDAADKKLSDTHLFAVEYMRPLLKQYPGLIDSSVFQMMLNDYIGMSNKLAFLSSELDERGKPKMWIFHKGQGDEYKGCWLSNKYSVENFQTRHNYGKQHGAANYSGNYGYNKNTGHYNDYDNDDYEYVDGIYCAKAWRDANKYKEKASEAMSGADVEALMESIEQYSGTAVKELEALFIEEPFLVFDMVNLLSEKTVDDSLLTLPAGEVAFKLHTLMQGYVKTKAA